ncbi:hypothetical protein J4Q44_G00138560 [Coregonus suidteri]|uniref:Uncharacterized protein n=1 Tax=Coregonus suidteri TaxID=861788 RepID=A0AAN8M0E8_9TELE
MTLAMSPTLTRRKKMGPERSVASSSLDVPLSSPAGRRALVTRNHAVVLRAELEQAVPQARQAVAPVAPENQPLLAALESFSQRTHPPRGREHQRSDSFLTSRVTTICKRPRESDPSTNPSCWSSVAQLVEHGACNAKLEGNPLKRRKYEEDSVLAPSVPSVSRKRTREESDHILGTSESDCTDPKRQRAQ